MQQSLLVTNYTNYTVNIGNKTCFVKLINRITTNVVNTDSDHLKNHEFHCMLTGL